MSKQYSNFEVKQILKKRYPKAQFKVRLNRYSGGSSIRIYTNLLREYEYKPDYMLNEEEKIKQMKMREYNQKVRTEIESLLSEFWHVDRCEFSGEILAGGNRYLFVENWSDTQWLK